MICLPARRYRSLKVAQGINKVTSILRHTQAQLAQWETYLFQIQVRQLFCLVGHSFPTFYETCTKTVQYSIRWKLLKTEGSHWHSCNLLKACSSCKVLTDRCPGPVLEINFAPPTVDLGSVQICQKAHKFQHIRPTTITGVFFCDSCVFYSNSSQFYT